MCWKTWTKYVSKFKYTIRILSCSIKNFPSALKIYQKSLLCRPRVTHKRDLNQRIYYCWIISISRTCYWNVYIWKRIKSRVKFFITTFMFFSLMFQQCLHKYTRITHFIIIWRSKKGDKLVELFSCATLVQCSNPTRRYLILQPRRNLGAIATPLFAMPSFIWY